MTVESALYPLLAAAAAPYQVYMSFAPLDAPKPLVIYTMQGPDDLAPSLGGQSSLASYSVQVDAWAADAATAARIGDAIRAALKNASSGPIRHVEIGGGFDDVEPGDGAVPINFYRRATDITLYVEQ